jgi:hypothetical protein
MTLKGIPFTAVPANVNGIPWTRVFAASALAKIETLRPDFVLMQVSNRNAIRGGYPGYAVAPCNGGRGRNDPAWRHADPGDGHAVGPGQRAGRGDRCRAASQQRSRAGQRPDGVRLRRLRGLALATTGADFGNASASAS